MNGFLIEKKDEIKALIVRRKGKKCYICYN